MKTLLALLATISIAQAADQRALYISPRTDGSSGSGSATDPFNGSTPYKLLRAWNKAAFPSDGVTNRAITFLPGRYTCTNELRLPTDAADVIIMGYGATIVYAEKGLIGQRTVLSTSWSGNDRVTIEGFTIDCGSETTYTNASNSKVGGIFSKGKGNIVRDCYILRPFCYNSAAVVEEAFGIVMDTVGGMCSGNIVQGNAGTGNQNITGIAVSGLDSVIGANVVDLGDDSPTNDLTSFGFSIYGSRMTMSANTARGVDAGISMDGSGSGAGGVWSDNLVIANQFSGNEMCVRINNNTQSYTNWVWAGNDFHASGRTWLSIWTSDPWISNSDLSGHSFIGNLFSGVVRSNANITLSNYKGPHIFTFNRFSDQPDVNSYTNRQDLIGPDNIVKGKKSERVW